MAETILRGPNVNAGSLMDNTVTPMDGPDMSYQASVVLDPRFGPMPKDGLLPGRVKGWLNSPYFVLSDNIPMIASSTVLAAAQSASLGTALVLTTTSVAGSAAGVPSIAAGVPIVPLGTTVATSVTALDFGFATGTTAANSSTVVVVDSSYFQQGQWIIIGGAGASNQTSIITQVQAISNATTIKISPVAVAALSNAPIGQANLFGQTLLPPATQFGPSGSTPNAHQPYSVAGLAAAFNPLEGLARNLCVQGSTTNSTTAFLCTGYDMYGALMTELITASGTTAVYGKKAFKYVQSAVAQGTNTGVFTLGIGDTFGFHVRIDKWEFSNIFYNGSFGTNLNGWTAAATTAPTLNTSGDVRGTIQVSLRGALATSFNSVNATTNGTGRLTIMMSVPLYNVINATALNTVPMLGVAQSTT
jgi:hypothetical protein